jgi:hypothetical protein
MLKIITPENNILMILLTIILNYILFLSSSLLILIKLNFILFVFFTFYYFYKYEKNKFLILFLLALIIISLGTPTNSWDARSIWIFKAKEFFYDHSIISVKNNYAEFSHNNYPSIAPAFAAGLSTLIGYWNEIFPKAALTLMFIPPLIIISRFFDNNFFLMSISVILFIIGKFLVNGELDGLVALYFVSSLIIIYNLKNLNYDIFKQYLGLIFFLIILSLLKAEGAVLLICSFIGSMLTFYKKKYLCKNLIISFFVSIIPVLIWNYFCIYNNIGNTNSDNIFNINNFANRILYLKNYILIFEYLLLNEKFLFGLIVFLVSTIYIKNKDILIYVSSISLIYILFLFIVYLSTPLDLEWHLNSANRIIKPIALFLSIFSLYNILNKQHKI